MGVLKTIFYTLLFLISFFSCDAKYFQQDVSYTIHVTLNDKTHELSANEVLIYKNNSSSVLKELYFHLYPNAYKNNNTVLAKEIFLSGDDRMLSLNESGFGFIDSLDFRINDEKVQWNTLEDTIDICRIILNRPLNPGDSISISTPFHVKIPSSTISRLGHTDQAYFITQWFPKPAVYDENGWNYFPYLDQGEYYSEFGKFDAYITLPENYVLAATGKMVDGDKENAWLEVNDSITRTIKFFSDNDSIPKSSKIFKTIHFTQDMVHDFAWFADKRWHVLKNKTTVPGSGKTINTWAYFNNFEANFWLKSPEYLEDAIQYYSTWVGEYPYEDVSAVDVGNAFGSGMEYPMITAIGNYGDAFDLEATIAHEVGHNWFYGILGSNEHCHPWMDEGINNFYETRYVYTKYKSDSLQQMEKFRLTSYDLNKKTNSINHRRKQYYGYISGARQNTDQQSDLCSNKLSIQNYRSDVYHKPSVSFDYLKSYLGDSMFDACMRKYYDEWKFKHPQPNDLKQVFEKVSEKKMEWIFDDLISTTKKLDYKIVSAQLKDSGIVELEIKNIGTINGTLTVDEIKQNNVINSKWIEGFSGEMKIRVPCSGCDQYKIDSREMLPDLNESNNTIRMNGVFRKMEKLKLSIGFHIEDPQSTQIFYLPVIGWNNYNKFMAGVVIHNISFHEKKFEYRIMPLYATGTKNLSGGAGIKYHLYPNSSRINKITLSSGISRYAFGQDEYSPVNEDYYYSNILQYTKLDSKIIFSILQNNRQDKFKNEFILRNIIILRDIPYQVHYKEVNKDYIYWQAEFRCINTNPLKSSSEIINLTYSNNFFSASSETKYFINYGEAKKGFNVRMFLGYTKIPEHGDIGNDYEMSLSGRDGSKDYLFDEVFLGRSESSGILSHQFVNDFAGFKTPTTFYRVAEEWMFGFNVNTTLPGIIPFRLFANAGTFDGSDQNGTYGNISWELGVDLPIIKDIFVIYLPFAYSKDIKYAIKSQDMTTGDLIRFELHLNLLNPLDLVKTIYDN